MHWLEWNSSWLVWDRIHTWKSSKETCVFLRHYWDTDQSAACVSGILNHFLDGILDFLGMKYLQVNSRALQRLVCICYCSHISETYCQSFDKGSMSNNGQFTSIPDCHLLFWEKNILADVFWRQHTTTFFYFLFFFCWTVVSWRPVDRVQTTAAETQS